MVESNGRSGEGKPLEVEPLEPGREDGGESYAAQRAASAAETAAMIRGREARWQETTRAIRENPDRAADLSAFSWKAFLGLGAGSLVYFLSLVVLDPANFRDGVKILAQGAFQVSVVFGVWHLVVGVYRSRSERGRKEMEHAVFGAFLALGSLLLLAAMGFAGRGVWTSVPFVLSLALEIAAAVWLARLRRRLRDVIAFEAPVPAHARPVVYLSEGLLLYLGAAIFLQAFLHVHVPMILGYLLTHRAALVASCVPLAGYYVMRKFIGEL